MNLNDLSIQKRIWLQRAGLISESVELNEKNLIIIGESKSGKTTSTLSYGFTMLFINLLVLEFKLL